MIPKHKIANKLLSIRLEHAMTQKDFGLECGLSSSVISQYEQGLRNPRKKHCIKYVIDIALILKILTFLIRVLIYPKIDIQATLIKISSTAC